VKNKIKYISNIPLTIIIILFIIVALGKNISFAQISRSSIKTENELLKFQEIQTRKSRSVPSGAANYHKLQ